MALNAILAVAATAGVVQGADSARRAAHAQSDAINAANEAQKAAEEAAVEQHRLGRHLRPGAERFSGFCRVSRRTGNR